jgi:hypothetical protein
MLRVKLDSAPLAVKAFVRGLPLDREGVELELNGQVVCKVIGRHELSDSERDAILKDGLGLISRARQRNKGVPSKVIDREILAAVKQARGRKTR